MQNGGKRTSRFRCHHIAICVLGLNLVFSADIKAQSSVSSILSLISGSNIGKQLKELFEALRSGGDLVMDWVGGGNCVINRHKLTQIQSQMNLLASNKLSLSNFADRYVINDPTATKDQLSAKIRDVTQATEELVVKLKSADGLFKDKALSKPYREIITNLDDRKGGILPRMESAIRKSENIHQLGEGQPSLKVDVSREANALRVEAVDLGSAADDLGSFITKINCKSN